MKRPNCTKKIISDEVLIPGPSQESEEGPFLNDKWRCDSFTLAWGARAL